MTGHDGILVKTVYDSYLRPWKRIAKRNNNTTETTYVTGTRLVASVKEKAGTTSPITVAQYSYDPLGRRVSDTNADSKTTYFAFNRRGQVIRQWGAATSPVAYAYNSYGEQIAMRTFRSPSQDFTTSTWPLSDDGSDPLEPNPANWQFGDKTSWVYDAGTGLLTTKTDASNRSVTYTYGADRQVATRAWARTVSGQPATATYSYSSTTGEQTGISYNDGTPAVSYTYTRLGQLDSATDGASGVHDFVYDPDYPWRLYAEAFDTFYGQRVLTRQYETSGMVGRGKGFKLGTSVGSNSELEQTYGYAAATGRFDSLTSGRNSNAATRTFHYGYETDSPLVKTLWTDDNSFFVTRSFEANRDLLTSIESKWGQGASTAIAKYAYTSNTLGQRENVEQSGDAFTSYYSTGIHQTFTYNPRGELTAAPTRLGTVAAPGATIADRQHEFDYDLIGNRKWAGLTGSSGDRKNYSSNALNQYATRDNSIAPFIGSQAFTYDDDGNLLTDGLWNYAWDAENRLVRMSSALPSGQGYTRLELNFKYDYLGRRVEKKVENLDGPTPNFTHRYVYDGWNLIAEYAYASSTLTLTRTYTWGLDIARSLTDAGGVGALLQIADHASGKAWQPAYDGNGNLAALVNGSTGTVAAVYEYSPYGELLRNVAPDSAAAGQPFRFSTKFTDDETGLVYYGHRFYSPSQGRFLGRDPKQEPGGLNLYGFCRNNSINLWDYLGMKPDWDGSPGDVETILEEIEPGVFAYVTYRWQFIETGSSGGEFDVYDWVQVGRPMSAGGRDSSGAEGSTRGLPESGGLYGTGLAMIPAFPFLGAVTATPPQATPSVPFEFISGGLRDDGDFNLYLALRYTGKDSLIVETTVSVRWGPGDNEVLNFDPIYSNLASNGSSSFQSTKGGSFTQVTPIGNTLRIGDPPETPQYLTNALGALGVNRPTSAGTITVNIRYAPGSLPVTGGLSESNARFFLNEYDHNRVGSAPPTGFSMGNATTQKMLISWNGAGDMTMRSTILVGGADRVGSPPIGKLVAPTSFPLP